MRVTINNVRTPAQLAGKLARQIEADSATIVGALTDPATARKAGFDSVTLFSMFIPDTYEFYWTVSPAQFIERSGANTTASGRRNATRSASAADCRASK